MGDCSGSSARRKASNASLRLWYCDRCAVHLGHANYQRRCIPRLGSHGTGDPVKRSGMALSRVSSRALSSRRRVPGCRRFAACAAAKFASRSTSSIGCVNQREHRRRTRAPYHHRSCAIHEHGTRFPSRKPVLVPRCPHCASRRSLRPARRTTIRTSPPAAGLPTLASRPQRTPAPDLSLALRSPTKISHYSLPLLSHSYLPPVSHSTLLLPLNTQITRVSALPLPSDDTLTSIPTAIQHASINDPPYEKNGSGNPVIGIRFSVMPTFTNT